MDDKMTEEQRVLLKQFMDQYTDPEPAKELATTGLDGPTALVKMMERVIYVLENMPIEELVQPPMVISITGYLHAIAELEQFLQVGSVDIERTAFRTRQFVDDLIVPVLERYEHEQNNGN